MGWHPTIKGPGWVILEYGNSLDDPLCTEHHVCLTADCVVPARAGRCRSCEHKAREWIVSNRIERTTAAECERLGIVSSLLYGDIDYDHLAVLRELARGPGRTWTHPKAPTDPDRWKSMDWRRVAYAADHPPEDEDKSGPSGADILSPDGRDAVARRIRAEIAAGRRFAQVARSWGWPDSTVRDLYHQRISDLVLAARLAADERGECDVPMGRPTIRRGRPRKTAPQPHTGAEGVGTANPPTPSLLPSDDAA